MYVRPKQISMFIHTGCIWYINGAGRTRIDGCCASVSIVLLFFSVWRGLAKEY